MTVDISSLLNLIACAGEQELHAIESRIAEVAREMEKACAPFRAELTSLRCLQRTIQAKLLPAANGRLRKRGSCQSKASDMTDMQQRIYDLIVAEGSMPVPAIAKMLKQLPGNVGKSVMASSWFEVRNGEVHIAKT